MSYNKRTHLRQNIDAIRLALKLDKEHREATTEERDILAAYSGFGGIKAILSPADKPEDIERWSKSEAGLFPLVQELHEVLRENSPTPEVYKRYVSSLKNSILTAFYTPKPVIDVLAYAIKDSGITPTRFLEPSAGTGAFISSFKETAPEAKITGFEKDLLTGKILSHLYPQDKIRIEGYEKIEKRYAEHFDVIASNIPFGDVSVFDPLLSNHEIPAVKQSTQAIHNYFFVKSVMSAREGGIIAFITSQGVLNSEQNKPIREYLMNTCDIVSAIRLPNNLFSDHAGTEVGSDLIVLQRNNNIIVPSQRQQDFIESRKLSNGISVNNLFRDFSRVVQTHSKTDTDPYGKPAIVFTHEGGVEGIAKDLRQMLKEDFSQHLDLQRYQTYAPEQEVRQERKSTWELDMEEHSLGWEDVLDDEQLAEQGFSTTRKEQQPENNKTTLESEETSYPDDLNFFWQAIEDHWFPDDKKFWDNKEETATNLQPERKEDEKENQQSTTQQQAVPNTFRGTLFDMDDPAIKKTPTMEAKLAF
jgi:adenine-specific DNA methylase